MKALFLTIDPGGAAFLAPIIRGMEARGWQTETWSRGLGAERFQQEEIPTKLLPTWDQPPEGWLRSSAASLLMTSASSLPWVDFSERWAWRAGNQGSIPSIAFVDSWQNYRLRFSGCGPGEDLAFLPDLIGCPDALARREMEACGFPAGRLRVWGHPGLDQTVRNFRPGDRTRFWWKEPERLACFQILFVSEAITEHFGRSRGYDQTDCFQELARWLENCSAPVNLLIKLHPKESRTLHLPYFQTVARHHRVVTLEGTSPLDALGLADLVVGMTSMLLIEANAVGKPVISLQPGLRGEDPLVLSRHHYVEVVERMPDLDECRRITGQIFPRLPFAWDGFLAELQSLTASG